MEIILKQDVENLGNKDEIVVVRDGYANNFLIPTGKAIVATSSAKKMHAENLKQRAHKEAKVKNDALELGAKIEAINLTIGAKVSNTGKIFGSVNNIQIAEALEAQGFIIDRKMIVVSDVKEIGAYTADVKLHRDVKVKVNFTVVAE
jgi:large subunit ribosomal protein L9